MTENEAFPTFECAISGTVENYDSDVELYFINAGLLMSKLAQLKLADPGFQKHYDAMIDYIHDLNSSIIEKKSAPDHQFLINLCMGPEEEKSSFDLLKRGGGQAVPLLVESVSYVRLCMFWYVRMAGVDRFASGFTKQRFAGLPFLRLALAYRAAALAN